MTQVKPAAEQIVYIVDDDDAMRDSLVWLVESQGFVVQAFASAEAFVAAYRDEMTGCVVLDVRMPGMSGLELHEWLTARQSVLPVVFISGHGDVPMAVSALKKGAVDFIEKPFNDRDMLTSISISDSSYCGGAQYTGRFSYYGAFCIPTWACPMGFSDPANQLAGVPHRRHGDDRAAT